MLERAARPEVAPAARAPPEADPRGRHARGLRRGGRGIHPRGVPGPAELLLAVGEGAAVSVGAGAVLELKEFLFSETGTGGGGE